MRIIKSVQKITFLKSQTKRLANRLEFMIENKEKTKVKKYYCFWCHCTGFINKKQTIFQIWNWGYEFINKKICQHCNGRGFTVLKHKHEIHNNYKSFLEH